MAKIIPEKLKEKLRKKPVKVEEQGLTDEQKQLVSKVNRVNRRPIAEDIFLGLTDEQLYEKYDKYSVQEMKREIAKLQGNNVSACLSCRV